MNNRRPETQPICLLAFACYIIWCAPVEGTSVALWGKRALIGANTTYVFPNETGAAYTFDRDGTKWRQETEITPPPPDNVNGESFGVSVSLSGSQIVVGASGDKNSKGAAFVFTP